MWNLTPDYIQQVKEELKGRRAAIEARYADELKGIEEDLEEIETLERAAYAFAVKHLSEPLPAEPVVELAMLQPLLVDPADAEPEAPVELDAKGVSRWRMRLDAHSDSEPP
jgi:hypothetical protein